MKYLLALLFLMPFAAYSQCNFTEDKYDDFTKQKVRETDKEWLYIDLAGSTGFSIRQLDSLYFIKMTVTASYPKAMVIGKDGELMFKLATDSIVTLASIDVFSGSIGANSTTLVAIYEISKVQLAQLSKFGIVKFRYYEADGYIEKDVKPKKQGKLMPLASCISD